MNKFEFNKDEKEYLKEIHLILKFSEFPNLFYAIGYDKSGKRKIFLLHTDIKNGDEYTYVIAEILSVDHSQIDDIEFKFSQKNNLNYEYGRKTPWRKFWSRLTQR